MSIVGDALRVAEIVEASDALVMADHVTEMPQDLLQKLQLTCANDKLVKRE
jgi:hypothetical protein